MKCSLSKKGEVGLNVLLLGILAFVILVLVAWFLFYFFQGRINPFFDSLGFNLTKPVAVEEEIFRFRLGSEAIEYYDGNRWNPVPLPKANDPRRKSDLQLNDKFFLHDEIGSVFFYSYFTQNRIQKNIMRLDGGKGGIEIKGFRKGPDKYDKNTFRFYIFLTASIGQETNAEYLLDHEGKLYKWPNREGYDDVVRTSSLDRYDKALVGSEESNIIINYESEFSRIENPDDIEKQIVQKAEEWRDSVLKQPIKFVYYSDSSLKDKKEIMVCINKRDQDLIVNLAKKWEGGECDYKEK